MPSEIGSRPAKGSSYITRSGSSAIARASATRRAMPPETSLGIRSRAPRRPTASSFISTMSRTSASGSCGVLAQRKGHVVEHAHVGEQRAELEQHAHARAVPHRAPADPSLPTSWPSNSTSPRWARCWPPIRRSTVVLPPPDAPIEGRDLAARQRRTTTPSRMRARAIAEA